MRKRRQELFEDTVERLSSFLSDSSDRALWIRDIEFLRDLSFRRDSGQPDQLTEEEKERLLDLSGRGAPLGPFSGLAVRDVADQALCDLLYRVQKEANRLARAIPRWSK